MALLWPERDATNGRRLLNLAVHVLRAALDDDAIASTGDGLLFDPTRVSCDLHDLRAAMEAGDHERVVRLYAGPLMDGFHLAESAEFEHWLEEHRSELAHEYVGALLKLVEQQEQSDDVHGRVGTCRKLVAADPYSAAHAQRLMRALSAAGDRAGAAQHADEHARRLRVDLDLPPDAEVVALAARMRSALPSSQPAAATSPPLATVAVLPFRFIGADTENEWFADGVTEDVIAHLSKIKALTVISRTSVMRFKDRPRTIEQIGMALGATAVLEGSVRRAADRVRIVVQLIDVASDRPLWTETYDRQITDIFAIQTEVALNIAAALRTELTAEERTRVKSEPTIDIRAYQYFLQGRQSLVKFTPDSMTRAIELFQRAISHDKAFAIAHALTAMAYIELVESGAMAPASAYQRARDAANTALRIDPDLGEAHCAMGHLKFVAELAWADAEREFKRAIELSPGSADAYDLYGRMCVGIGRMDEGIALLTRAQELDPLAHRIDLATALIRAGRLPEAIMRAESAVEVEPFDRARATLGWAYFLSGRTGEGIAQLERAVESSPKSTMWMAQLGEAYGLAGDSEKAREILCTLDERARSSFVSPYHFAYVYTGLGETDRAIEWLERALAERTGAAYGIRGSFLFAPLQTHPKFKELLRRMRLE